METKEGKEWNKGNEGVAGEVHRVLEWSLLHDLRRLALDYLFRPRKPAHRIPSLNPSFLILLS